MRTIKLSWSEKRKNRIINFYAMEPDSAGKVEVVTLPIGMRSSEEAKGVINQDRVAHGKKPYLGHLLNVCFDMSSGLLYLPDMQIPSEVANNPKLSSMLGAVKYNIEKHVSTLPNIPVVRGDPFDTIRLRKIVDFGYASTFIRQQLGDGEEVDSILNIPVVEANISVMPKVQTLLPPFKNNSSLKGIYVTERQAEAIAFSMNDRGQDILLHTQKTPFLLINTSPGAKTSEADKDRLITSLYRDYAISRKAVSLKIEDSPQVHEIKHLMYIGWSFRELCMYMLSPERISNFDDLIVNAAFVYNASKLIKRDGYPDPSRIPYYYSFEIGQNFPIRFKPQASGRPYDVSNQPEILQILHYDPVKSYIVIKSPLWMSEELCNKVLGAKSTFFRAQYSPSEMSIKSEYRADVLKKESSVSLKMIHEDVIQSGGKAPEGKPGIPFVSNTEIEKAFERKHISDYPQAADIIKTLCAKTSTEEKKINFDDLEVVVGPWLSTSNFLGGYINKRRLEMMGLKPPMEPIPGCKIYPPAILLDNEELPSVGDRIHVIVHEYRHHVNMQLWIESPQLKDMPKGMNTAADVAKWLAYLNSPDEHLAHLAQFKYMLGLGMTKDEIVKMVMRTKPTATNFNIAKKYLEIIDEADQEMKKEEKDERSKKEMERAVNEIIKDSPGRMDSSNLMFDPEGFADRY